MLVKKLILALFLSVGICAVGAQTDVYASEPTVQEDGATGNDGEIRKEYVDLSDSVIQEGGFPKAAGTSRKSRSAVDSDKEKEVQKVLLATWDSFAESCDLSSYGLTVTYTSWSAWPAVLPSCVYLRSWDLTLATSSSGLNGFVT